MTRETKADLKARIQELETEAEVREQRHEWLVQDYETAIQARDADLARRHADLTALQNDVVSMLREKTDQVHFLGQTLVAIAGYGGSNIEVPCRMAAVAVSDFIPE